MSVPKEEKLGLDRLIFFTDAVIAIAITLLVLEIKVPEIEAGLVNAQLTRQVLALWPKYVGYITSFFVIGMYWISHHRSFCYIKSYDHVLIYINLLFLMFIAFVPFPTALLFTYPARLISVTLYAGTMAVIGLMKVWLWWYATHNHRLVEKTLDQRMVKSFTMRLLVAPVIFLISIGIALFNARFAMYSWGMILPMVFYFVFRPVEISQKCMD